MLWLRDEGAFGVAATGRPIGYECTRPTQDNREEQLAPQGTTQGDVKPSLAIMECVVEVIDYFDQCHSIRADPTKCLQELCVKNLNWQDRAVDRTDSIKNGFMVHDPVSQHGEVFEPRLKLRPGIASNLWIVGQNVGNEWVLILPPQRVVPFGKEEWPKSKRNFRDHLVSGWRHTRASGDSPDQVGDILVHSLVEDGLEPELRIWLRPHMNCQRIVDRIPKSHFKQGQGWEKRFRELHIPEVQCHGVLI
jgi:hypothetical protein